MAETPSKPPGAIHLENVEDVPKDLAAEILEDQARYTPQEIRRMKRQIDWRVIPSLGLMFGISLMDRSNVSNAAIAGMREDLHLETGYRYSLVTLCFFVTYVIVQAPMTIACRKLGPRLFLPGVCAIWGGVIVGFGFSQNWTTLVGLRLLLGCLEAGFFPGSVYLLSTWYTRCKYLKIRNFEHQA